MMDKPGDGSSIDWEGYRRLSPVLEKKTDEELQVRLINNYHTVFKMVYDYHKVTIYSGAIVLYSGDVYSSTRRRSVSIRHEEIFICRNTHTEESN